MAEYFLAKYLALIATIVGIGGGFVAFLQYNRTLKKERRDERERFLQTYKKTIIDELDGKFKEVKATIQPLRSVFGTMQIIDDLNQLKENIRHVSKQITNDEIEDIRNQIEVIKEKMARLLNKSNESID